MEAKTGKMNWLIDLYKEDKVEYEIHNTGRLHGAISKPTGSGKSSLFINDIIYRILHHGERKLMVNISTPIIKLCEQQGNDFMEVLEAVKDICNINVKEIKYFINNSGNIESYKDNNKSCTLHPFNKHSINSLFLNSQKCNIAIVINCHPSLSNSMIPWIKNLNNDIDIVTYIDEAHTLSSKIITEMDDTQIDLNSLCEKSDVYLVSATNKKELVENVNKYDGINNDSYIIFETPAEAIKANKICVPKVHIKQTTLGEIDFNICNDFMNMIIADGNIHKVLISCKDTNHLRKLKKELKDNGYTVFSTCSSEGMNWSDTVEYENSNHKFQNVVEFITAIDNCKTNCFILHIRQMISGIDVGSISDCIIQKNDTDNYNSYSNVIQTIGRSLRLGSERGKNIEDRKKKYANVLFVTEESNETVYPDIEKFMINYYGLGNYEFHIGWAGQKYTSDKKELKAPWENMYNVSNNTINYWENIKANIRKYLIEKVKPIIDNYKQLGISYEKTIEDQIDLIERKYNENLSSIYIFKFIENDDLRKEIENIAVEIFPYKNN